MLGRAHVSRLKGDMARREDEGCTMREDLRRSTYSRYRYLPRKTTAIKVSSLSRWYFESQVGVRVEVKLKKKYIVQVK